MTSIAALSSHYASAVRRGATSSSSVAVGAPDAVGQAPRVTREQPRRHELLDAMNEVLNAASDGVVADDERSQSVLRFAHALMQDLRTLAGESAAGGADGPHPSSWGDLPQRLSALATAASQPPAQAAAAAAADMPDQPNPVTTATAAVHIMKVPSSRLVEAFIAMHRALGQQGDVQAGHERAALADLARRLAGSVPAASRAAPAAGAVLDMKA